MKLLLVQQARAGDPPAYTLANKLGVTAAWEAVATALNSLPVFKNRGGITPKMARYQRSNFKQAHSNVKQELY